MQKTTQIRARDGNSSLYLRYLVVSEYQFDRWIRSIPVNVKRLFDLNSRVAIVTGASKGLGYQMAQGLAEAGADLVLCARKLPRCQQAADDISLLGVKILALACDATNPANIQAVVDKAFAGSCLNPYLINNAGTSWGRSGGGDET